MLRLREGLQTVTMILDQVLKLSKGGSNFSNRDSFRNIRRLKN